MKIYFFKNDIRSYQIFPTPGNLNNFIIVEVNDISELENKVLVKSGENYKLVEKPSFDFATWNEGGNGWVVDENLVAQAVADKKESLNSLIENKVLALINQSKEYTEFDQQRLEAQIWTLDNSNPVPLLTSISETIGMPLPELVQKCLEKTETQSKRKGVLIGQEVEFKRKVKKATKLDELEKIDQDIIAWK